MLFTVALWVLSSANSLAYETAMGSSDTFIEPIAYV